MPRRRLATFSTCRRQACLATALVILFHAGHPKLIVMKETQQTHPYQALARLGLVAISLFILWFGFSKPE
jgi:hypothetical protein